MKGNLTSRARLGSGLLRLYKQALDTGWDDVADRLPCALERLARHDPACGWALDKAYLYIQAERRATVPRTIGHRAAH